MKYTEKKIREKLFTKKEIKRVIDEEYKIFENINKNYSSIEEFNKAGKEHNKKIIKDGERYKLIIDGDGFVTFDTKEDAEKFLEREKTMIISTANAIISGTDDDYITARMSLLFDNLKKASDEDKQEFIRLAEINNRVTKREEAICVGNYLYFNMGENYVAMNIHNLSSKTVKEVDYSDFVITKDIK